MNQLTPAQMERLAMLAEECAEVIQVIGKIQRHGYYSYHPDNPNLSNLQLLQKELHDLSAVLFGMYDAGDGFFGTTVEVSKKTWIKKLQFTHYQGAIR